MHNGSGLGGSGLGTYKNHNQSELQKSSIVSKAMKGGIRSSVDSAFSPNKKESDFLPSLGMNNAGEKGLTPLGRNQKVADTLPIMPNKQFKKNEIVS